MFIGHFAVGFAAKRCAPRASLGVLTGAALLLDFIWAVLVLVGVEHVRVDPGNTAFTPLAFVSYPVSHSLVMTMAWAIISAGLYLIVTHYWRGALAVGLAVVSHWVLDAVSHKPDMPLAPGSSVHIGLGLWNSIPATLMVEGGLFVAGVWLYATGTRSRDRVGRVGLGAYVAVLVLLYIANLVGPPPPSGQAVAISDVAGLVLVVWALSIDRHRRSRVLV